MTQRVDLSTVMDRLAIDDLVTEYAVAVDDGDWTAYRALFTDDGRADYRSSGGIEGPVSEVAVWMAENMARFSVRQHLIVNRRVSIEDLGGWSGDRAEVRADYVCPMRLGPDEDLVCGGRYVFALARTGGGWRLRGVVVEERWRRGPG
ncbi:nuclear transport factor 2 family protein [Streptomyces qinzhouensis]|uniref:nuclear transport factor 2 family protein n=1 Tax=Streptomyces qinzhouensis TaxID=2599401 RepID=UPI001646EB0C|nr:nuclear transport factor 2 family protein [Streptomyces qinzhouensis]